MTANAPVTGRWPWRRLGGIFGIAVGLAEQGRTMLGGIP